MWGKTSGKSVGYLDLFQAQSGGFPVELASCLAWHGRCLRQEHFNIHVPPKFQMVESKLQMDKAFAGKCRSTMVHDLWQMTILYSHMTCLFDSCFADWISDHCLSFWYCGYPLDNQGAIFKPFFRDPWRWLCFNVSLVAWGHIGEAQDSLGGYFEEFQIG